VASNLNAETATEAAGAPDAASRQPGEMTPFYDTHAHLDYPEFAGDLPQVVERARAAGITKIICIGTDLDSSARAIALAERFENLYAVVGWHPCEALRAPEDLRPALRALARHPKVVALGETGLDFHRLPGAREGGTPEDDRRYTQRQADLFRQHLEIAAQTGLNCVIHQRDALDATLEALAPFAERVRGVFHCFANDAQAMRRVLALGSFVSFTGILTFKNGGNVRETLAATPPGKFMLETDCPFLAPMPHRGKRCEPAHVREIARVAAQVKGCTLEQLSQWTCAAAHEFFPKLAR
jgi:TatD DNase family protein